MNRIKKHIKYLLKTLGLFPLVEILNFNFVRMRNRSSNHKFKKENPSVVLPPDFYMYETFALNYDKIYKGGLETSKWVINHFEKYMTFKDKVILDWGCGSGRVIRHLPNLIDKSSSIYGTDYNEKYVKWCRENIQRVTIKQNSLSPPLPFGTSFFDAIYGISIFTHLSKQMHFEWMKELGRVIKNNGVVMLTTHGNSFEEKLSKKERQLFNEGELIEHSYKIEGNRLYASYQSPLFFKDLCMDNGFDILEHVAGKTKNNKPQQDVWILRKK